MVKLPIPTEEGREASEKWEVSEGACKREEVKVTLTVDNATITTHEAQWPVAFNDVKALRHKIRDLCGMVQRTNLLCLERRAVLYDMKNYGLDHDIWSKSGVDSCHHGRRPFASSSHQFIRTLASSHWGNTYYRSLRLASSEIPLPDTGST